MALPDLVVFSHLRWGFVHQRPQHLLTRLAGRWRVWFVEEPVHCEGSAHIEAQAHGAHLTVLVPHTPVAIPGFHDDQLAVLGPLVSQWLARHDVCDPVAWLYTPMALPLVNLIDPSCVVYDCMDELSAFKDAPRQLRQRETALMKRAAVVFTGGPSLYAAKRNQHDNAHCIPSSVDANHYAPSSLKPGCSHEQMVHALQAHLPRPRLGYFGVIDERLDMGLIGHLADTRPDWQIVIVGPVVKVDPASLPRRPNVHWLGMQPYDRLPYFLAGWDLCLMPFALNESTKFISPTKTLEYMAGEKPVVSTPVKDVIWLYGNAVEVAQTKDDFVQACEKLLNETTEQRYRRAREMMATVSTSSWDRSAESVHRLMHVAHDAAMRVRRAERREMQELNALGMHNVAATGG